MINSTSLNEAHYKQWMDFIAGCEDNGEPVPSHDPDAPAAVKATPVFKEGVEALRELLAPELTP
jgi:hypothetical protein